MVGWIAQNVCATATGYVGYQCPIPMRSVSRFNTVRDSLSKYCHSVTVRERQDVSLLTQEVSKVPQLSQRELFLNDFVPHQGCVRNVWLLFSTCWEVTGDVTTRQHIKH